jgi:hypothetical protein
MPTPCNIRYRKLVQLEAEFASVTSGGDAARLKELAAEIIALRQEFGGRHPECERLLNEETE